MKKVLSVLLAAAMVAGMSVSSFATDWTWTGPKGETIYGADNLEIGKNYVGVDKNGDGVEEVGYTTLADVEDLNPGDVLYFPIYVEDLDLALTLKGAKWSNENGFTTDAKAGDALPTSWDRAADLVDATGAVDVEEGTVDAANKYQVVKGMGTFTNNYYGKIDKNWTIKTKADKYVASASFAAWNGDADKYTTAKEYMGDNHAKFLKVTLVADIDTVETVEVDFEIFVKDKDGSESNTVAFDGALMTNEEIIEITASDDEEIFDVEDRIIVSVLGKANDVIFDFGDDIYFVNDVIKGEKFVLNLSQTYDAAIDKAYNEYDADLSFYNFKGTKDAFTKTGELFIPAEEETFIYEIVDGVITEIEAEYVTDEDILGMDIEDGWKIETKELGYYVVADEELVVPEVETEVEVETPAEPEKANPETGAADFVGAAVAMAVVSVAAAGALALKK